LYEKFFSILSWALSLSENRIFERNQIIGFLSGAGIGGPGSIPQNYFHLLEKC